MVCNSSFIFIVQESFNTGGMKFLPECDNVRYGVPLAAWVQSSHIGGVEFSLGVIIKI